MGLFDAFTNSASRQNVEIAKQVARRSCSAVWHKVQSRVLGMSVSEARGYIRAHASDVVDAETARCGVSQQRRDELAALARERVVETLAGEVDRMHRTQMGRRRAA